MLGDIGVQTEKWGFKLATKVYPWKAGDHQPERLRATFETSLKALKQDYVDIFYLHAPVS
jgi:aflatoxin B1 aldehyde reductase